MEAFFITHRNQRKQAYLYLSYKHLFVYLFVGFNQGFVHIFTRLYCLGGGGRILHTHAHPLRNPCAPGIAALPFSVSYCRIAPKFDRHLNSTAADMPVKLQSDAIILTSSLDQVVCFCPVVCIFARLCAVSNAPRSWEKREGCDSVSQCIPQWLPLSTWLR